jgi:hypothetical protein
LEEFPMKKLIGWLLVFALVVGGVGYWRGWFVFSKTEDNDSKTNLNVTVNKDKYREDKAAFLKAAREKLKELKETVEGMRSKSKDKTPEEKARADKEIQELEKKHQSLDAKLKEADKAAEETFEGTKADLNRALDALPKKDR